MSMWNVNSPEVSTSIELSQNVPTRLFTSPRKSRQIPRGEAQKRVEKMQGTCPSGVPGGHPNKATLQR